MNKAIKENKQKASIVKKKGLYENETYIGNLSVQTKIIRTKRTYSLPPSTLVTVFLIAEKLPSL